LNQFEESILAKGIHFYKNVQPDLNIESNKEQVQRLISILMDNATKYVSEKGIIEVYLSQVNKQVSFVVANTADNLEKLELDKIFDRFYRADDARCQKSGGYGIGLSAAKAIVHSLKGTITVQKQNDNKIIFVVKLHLE
ncbi:MAG: sensor histidine kinase, partial [Lachnospiraceae bacterium]|nr:sensor histidine kinase [Lachnospiraceae bacterium]